jgi:hypothetical protein
LEGDNGADDKENEANNFAAELLIPHDEYRHFHPRGDHFSEAEVVYFANRMGIAPGIVVGRLQHDRRLAITHLNGLKRRLIWVEEIEE